MKNRRKRGGGYSDEEKRDFILLFGKSGLNRHRFSREHGINYFTFLGWLKNEKLLDKPVTGFSEVVMQDQMEALMELSFGNGNRICFYRLPAVDYLKQLLSL